MNNLLRFETINEYSVFNNNETLHPLVNIIDLSKAGPRPRHVDSIYFGFYAIFLKDVKCGDLKYGRHNYDHQEGSLVFIRACQLINVDYTGETYYPKGHVLIFHQDLIQATSLGRHIQNYTFFGYQSDEALHLSEREKKLVLESLAKISNELEHPIDKHSKRLITSAIELLLNYCVRFYDRQFITREKPHKGILERFKTLLNDYFNSEKPQNIGFPSVAYCASELKLSPNYFGDLIKKETGKTAKEFIQATVIEVAKERIFDQNKSVSQIAFDLGFKYPQHFTRLFKQRVGQSPIEYRISAN